MIIDFKDLLLQHYRDMECDIPMVADVIEYGTTEISRVVETMLITNEAVRAAVDAGLDPMLFRILNRGEYKSGGMLFFTGSDEDYEYRLAGAISQTAYEGSYQEGWQRPVEADPHPAVDVMRKMPEAGQWQILVDGEWIDNRPPVGFLERLNELTNTDKQ